MATVNKVTKLYQATGIVDESTIQDHIDTQNNDGWNLIAVIDLGGWYRFFWEKVQ